jgi:hypothetical protein
VLPRLPAGSPRECDRGGPPGAGGAHRCRARGQRRPSRRHVVDEDGIRRNRHALALVDGPRWGGQARRPGTAHLRGRVARPDQAIDDGKSRARSHRVREHSGLVVSPPAKSARMERNRDEDWDALGFSPIGRGRRAQEPVRRVGRDQGRHCVGDRGRSGELQSAHQLACGSLVGDGCPGRHARDDDRFAAEKSEGSPAGQAERLRAARRAAAAPAEAWRENRRDRSPQAEQPEHVSRIPSSA